MIAFLAMIVPAASHAMELNLCEVLLNATKYETPLRKMKFPSIADEVKGLPAPVQVAKLVQAGRERTAKMIAFREELKQELNKIGQTLTARRNQGDYRWNSVFSGRFRVETRELRDNASKILMAIYEIDMLRINIYKPIEAFLNRPERELLDNAVAKLVKANIRRDRDDSPRVRYLHTGYDSDDFYDYRSKSFLNDKEIETTKKLVSEPYGKIYLEWGLIVGADYRRGTRYERDHSDYAERLTWQLATLGAYRPSPRQVLRSYTYRQDKIEHVRAMLTVDAEGNYKIERLEPAPKD
jgi:hypothetical protein